MDTLKVQTRSELSQIKMFNLNLQKQAIQLEL